MIDVESRDGNVEIRDSAIARIMIINAKEIGDIE